MLTTYCWFIQVVIETNKKKWCDQYHETNYEIKLRYQTMMEQHKIITIFFHEPEIEHEHDITKI